MTGRREFAVAGIAGATASLLGACNAAAQEPRDEEKFKDIQVAEKVRVQNNEEATQGKGVVITSKGITLDGKNLLNVAAPRAGVVVLKRGEPLPSATAGKWTIQGPTKEFLQGEFTDRVICGAWIPTTSQGFPGEFIVSGRHHYPDDPREVIDRIILVKFRQQGELNGWLHHGLDFTIHYIYAPLSSP